MAKPPKAAVVVKLLSAWNENPMLAGSVPTVFEVQYSLSYNSG